MTKVLKISMILVLMVGIIGCFSNNENGGNEDSISLSRLVLSSNKTEITADGTDTVIFSVKGYDQNNNEITPTGVVLYKDGVAQSGMNFNSMIVGSYSFTAKSENVMSNSISINVTPAVTEKLLSLKNTIDEFIIENEMNYQQIVDIYNQYKAILGAYNNENVLLKYLELKELFEKTNNAELKNYASSKSFEMNLFFMIMKYSIDNAGYYDKTSVIVSSFKSVNNTLELSLEEKDSNDKNIIKPLSYFNKTNYTELYRMEYSYYYINAKNKFGGYVGEKLVWFHWIYPKSGLVSIYTN